MSVCAEDFLSTAKDLLNNGNCEIDYRNSMSRAYYAAFHLLKTITDTLPSSTNSNPAYDSHNDTIDKLLLFPKDVEQRVIAKAIRNDIIKRKAQRKSADYKLNQSINEKDAEAQLESVSLLFDEINRLKTKLGIT